MNKPVLQAQALGRRFHEGVIDVTVLQGIDLQVQSGETLAVVGTSGSGKSTLLHLLGGLDTPTTGHVNLLGQALANGGGGDSGRGQAGQNVIGQAVGLQRAPALGDARAQGRFGAGGGVPGDDIQPIGQRARDPAAADDAAAQSGEGLDVGDKCHG